MNGYRWHVVAAELAELVRTVGPRVALVGITFLVVLSVPLVVRYWAFLARFGI